MQRYLEVLVLDHVGVVHRGQYVSAINLVVWRRTRMSGKTIDVNPRESSGIAYIEVMMGRVHDGCTPQVARSASLVDNANFSA